MIADKETFAPCYVFDGDGNPVHNLQWVNTETGEAEQTVVDETGTPRIARNAAGDYETLKVLVHIKLPIRLEPIGQLHRESLKQRELI